MARGDMSTTAELEMDNYFCISILKASFSRAIFYAASRKTRIQRDTGLSLLVSSIHLLVPFWRTCSPYWKVALVGFGISGRQTAIPQS